MSNEISLRTCRSQTLLYERHNTLNLSHLVAYIFFAYSCPTASVGGAGCWPRLSDAGAAEWDLCALWCCGLFMSGVFGQSKG